MKPIGYLNSIGTLCHFWLNQIVTQKGGSRKPVELTRSPTDPGSHTLSIHLRSIDTSPFLTWTIFLPSLTDLLAIWRLTNLATHHPTQHTQLWSYITHRCLWGKNTWTSFMDCIHSPRAQALPSNTISYKKGGADCPSNSSSLSLSLCSYSNELDHTSDAAETHNPNQNSLLSSYSLFSFFPHSLLFSSQKQKRPYCRSLPHLSLLHNPHYPPKTDFWSFLPVLRWLPLEASSNFPTLFHSPRSVLSLVTFIIQAPSMPAAMPNFTHTTQLKK